MTKEKAPAVSRELLEHLTRHYPDRAPDPKDSNRTVWMKAGQAELIRHLRKLHEDQSKNAL